VPRERLPHRVRSVPQRRRAPRPRCSRSRREFLPIGLEIVPFCRLGSLHHQPRRTHRIDRYILCSRRAGRPAVLRRQVPERVVDECRHGARAPSRVGALHAISRRVVEELRAGAIGTI
jgi:hypothetical protein